MSRGAEGGGGGVRSWLSGRPPHAWPQGVVHHGVRILMLVGLAVLVTGLFPPVQEVRVTLYEVGDVTREEVLARVPFSVPLSPAELAVAQREARSSVPPTFTERPEAADSTGARLTRLFERLEAAAEAPEPAQRIASVLEASSIPQVTESQVDLLLDPAMRGALRSAALEATRRILPAGVADATELADLSTDRVTVRTVGPEGESERSVSRGEILSTAEFRAAAVELLPATAPPDLQNLLRVMLIQHTEPTWELDLARTETDRQQAAEAVPTVREQILEGEAVVRANERVTPALQARLAAYEAELRARGLMEEEGLELVPFVGAGLLNLLLLAVFGTLLFFFRREVYANARWVTLITILVAVYALGAVVVARSGWPLEALPIAFVALALAVLWDGRMALMLAVILAVLSGLQPGLGGVPIIATTLVGGAAAAMSVRAVRRRAQTWIFIAIITSAYAAVILALSLLEGREAGDALWALVAAGANAVLSAIVAMGFLPVFEWFTGITTDQTLLEWADPNRDLLKRLSLEAPGTYAHTINVANLAEAAANAIGANGLLCRVGLYYHDVGKMLKPHYFVENQPEGRNPHDRLKPDTSAAIVREHVTEGVRLVREAKVPDVVAAFVGEHHGTQRIGFFFEKAKEEYGEENVDPAEYTYPGPRPRSRETAIAMLADSVESATRALQEPTPERIRDLVDSIVEAKVSAGQLDEAPLTLRELAQIKSQFVKVLSGVYHHRLDYPQTRHLTGPPTKRTGRPTVEGEAPDRDALDEVPPDGSEAEPEAR